MGTPLKLEEIGVGRTPQQKTCNTSDMGQNRKLLRGRRLIDGTGGLGKGRRVKGRGKGMGKLGKRGNVRGIASWFLGG